jgi:AraC family transcriptional regulator, regulatory protein of adaptative response / methylated-DNA-[protein]-cysteine methyltransferase
MDMTMVDYETLSQDYQLVEQAILFLERNFKQQPGLKEVAASVGLSEYHFQRLFSRWVGISPKRFLQFLTKEHAKRLLEESENLLETAYESGLSGPGRLHDLFVSCEAVTPGEYKQAGEGLQIVYGFHPSPFGECLIARTERGICSLSFIREGERQQALNALRQNWKHADLQEDPAATFPLVHQIFSQNWDLESSPLHLYLRGTNFQIKVWEALLRIPAGSVVSYKDIAVLIGMPKASRAVGRAVGQNPIPVIIPCHRVIRNGGEFGDYHWGSARKKALLGWEMAHQGVSA